MGLLAAANQWFSALMFVPGVLTQVLLPTYADRLAIGRPGEARALALRSAAILLLGISPIIAVLVYLSPFLAALYGPGFAHGGAVFALACLAAGIMAPCGALNNYVIARERMWARLAISLLWSATLLTGAFLLVSWGALGVSIATLVAYAIRVGATYLYAKRLMRA
jgi:O-antigen/teichoic acid export membrane protein